MMRAWYAVFFALAVCMLSLGGLFAFQRLESNAHALQDSAAAMLPRRDTIAIPKTFNPVAPKSAEYARFEAEDAAWRQRNARQYSVSELRIRGDGKRTAQQSLQDRVFALTRSGNRKAAIQELERWVDRHPGDQQALLSLARLLNETGRNDAAVERYRQLLAVKQRNGIE